MPHPRPVLDAIDKRCRLLRCDSLADARNPCTIFKSAGPHPLLELPWHRIFHRDISTEHSTARFSVAAEFPHLVRHLNTTRISPLLRRLFRMQLRQMALYTDISILDACGSHL